MTGKMIVDGLTYLSNDKNWAKNLLIGGGLLVVSGIIYGIGWILTFLLIGIFILPVALLIAFPVGGYYISVMRSTVRGEDKPPEFDDFGKLFKDGALAYIISAIYLFIPAVTLLISYILFIAAAFSQPGFESQDPTMTGPGTVQPAPTQPTPELSELATGLTLTGVFVLLLSYLLYFVFSYFLTIGLINFARKERFGAAFSLSTARKVAFSGDFIIGWLLGFVLLGFISTVIFYIGYFTIVIPIVGIFIVFLVLGFILPFITFYITVSSNRIMARGFTKALE